MSRFLHDRVRPHSTFCAFSPCYSFATFAQEEIQPAPLQDERATAEAMFAEEFQLPPRVPLTWQASSCTIVSAGVDPS